MTRGNPTGDDQAQPPEQTPQRPKPPETGAEEQPNGKGPPAAEEPETKPDPEWGFLATAHPAKRRSIASRHPQPV